MHTRTFVAFAFVALAGIAAVMVACSDKDKVTCTPGTLQIMVELDGTANYADTITVSVDNPKLTQTFTHTPNGDNLQIVDVSFPGGYPADKVVTVRVSASGGTTLLGENVFSIHLLPNCSTSFVPIHSFVLGPDGGASD